MPLPTPDRAWSHVAVDFVTDLPVSQGYMVIMVAVDRFSKRCKFAPLHSLPSAFEVAENTFSNTCMAFRRSFSSIAAPNSNSRYAGFFFRNLGVVVSLSTGYYLQTNEKAVRLIQELGRLLRAYCSSRQHEWASYLVCAEYAQNSICRLTTCLTLFGCGLGPFLSFLSLTLSLLNYVSPLTFVPILCFMCPSSNRCSRGPFRTVSCSTHPWHHWRAPWPIAYEAATYSTW